MHRRLEVHCRLAHMPHSIRQSRLNEVRLCCGESIEVCYLTDIRCDGAVGRYHWNCVATCDSVVAFRSLDSERFRMRYTG